LNEVAAKLRQEYADRTVELKNDAARLYAQHFTEKELKDALAFFKSPLGRKIMLEEPRILEDSMKNAQAWANKLSEEIIIRIREEMKKKGHEL
jgi:hypothetical protein